MIELRDVTYRYRRDASDVLSGVDLSLGAGTVTALLGPSGCGKSTMLYVCGLMLTPRSGEVLLDGQRVSGLSDHQRSRLRARSIGFIFQDAMLDATRSVADNVAEGAAFTTLPAPVIAERTERLLEEFGVADRAFARVADLSGGQAQRVALCRALVKEPAVVLADEPSGNLDRTNGDLVIDRLLAEAHGRGTTVLVVTHDERLAQRCDTTVAFEELHGSATPAA